MSRNIKLFISRIHRQYVLAFAVGSCLVSGAMAQTVVNAESPTVSATQKTGVSVRLEQFKVVAGPEGQERLVDASSVKPGDIVEYQATYTNRDAKPITGLLATLPIPNGMEYLPKTAKPGADRVKAAVQGGAYGAEPLKRVVQVNGKPLTETVPYAQYRSLQWSLGQLPPGGETQVKARVQVERFVPPKAAASLHSSRPSQVFAELPAAK